MKKLLQRARYWALILSPLGAHLVEKDLITFIEGDTYWEEQQQKKLNQRLDSIVETQAFILARLENAQSPHIPQPEPKKGH
ncbi:hypothetical protein VVR12_03180 [Rothia sp. LK2588]|uniref:hypothetical protein n=1 Tax=Rothia sp. LK2588 TaxID=3114369 RepID=UPI0034CFFB28